MGLTSLTTRFALWLAVLGVLAAAQAHAQASAALSWDPYEGRERNGRIPAVKKGVDRPDRWRYLPEGMLKPGYPWQRFLVSTFATPLVFADRDIGIGGGLALIDIDFREQRRREFAGLFGSYTSEGQQAYGFTWRRRLYAIDLPKGGVLHEDRSFVRAAGGYSRTLTRRFFGFGAGSKKSQETSFEDEIFDLNLSVSHALPVPGGDFIASAGLRAEFHELAPGAIDSDPTTDEIFSDVFSDAEHQNLGYLNLGFHWDTRDSQVNPYDGWRVGASARSALLQKRGDVGAVIALEARRVFSVPPLFHDGGDEREENPPTDTLTLILESSTTRGRLPFFALPTLGGSERLRGFIRGRFRDENHWFFGSEWRFWVVPRGFRLPFTRAIRVERIGLAPFAEAGSVAGSWDGLFRARVRASYGMGLRIALDRNTLFRVDLGGSGDGVNLSGRVGVAF